MNRRLQHKGLIIKYCIYCLELRREREGEGKRFNYDRWVGDDTFMFIILWLTLRGATVSNVINSSYKISTIHYTVHVLTKSQVHSTGSHSSRTTQSTL